MQREQKTKRIDELTDKQLEDVIGGMTHEAFIRWHLNAKNPRFPDKDDPVWGHPVVPIGSPTGPGGWFSDPVPDEDLEFPSLEPVPLPAVPPLTPSQDT